MDIWNVLFLIAAGQGIFVSALLFVSRGRNRSANTVLAVFLFLFSLNLLENVSYWTRYQLEVPHVIGSTRGFVFLFGPLLWLYVQRLIHPERKWRWNDSYHFVFFACYTALSFNFYLLPAEEKLARVASQELSFSQYAMVVLMCLHMLAYSILIWNKLKTQNMRMDAYTLKMIRSIGFAFSVFTLSYIVYYVLVETIDFKPEHDYFISMAGAIAIYQVGYFAFRQPEVLHGFIRREPVKNKYGKSPLTPSEAAKYLPLINSLLEQEKIYLNNDLRLSDLAVRLSIPPNYVSQLINEHFGKTFYELINERRVEEAKQKLHNNGNNDKLLAIAMESGFNNRTSFNILFKKYTGLSPKEYKARIHAEV